MDASSQKPHSYIAIGVCFVIVCAIVGCIIYYITKDNTKTEKFSPKITEQITTSPKITEQITTSPKSCQTMINILIRDMYTRIMGTQSPVNYQCTPESDRESFLDTLYHILQVPTLQILNNATSIDNLDKTNLIILWSTAMTGLDIPSFQITPIMATNFDGISGVTIKEDNVFLSASDLANRLSRSSDKSYPRIPSYIIPGSDYENSSIKISNRAGELLVQQNITIANLEGDNSIITADDITKFLLLLLVHTGTFFTK